MNQLTNKRWFLESDPYKYLIKILFSPLRVKTNLSSIVKKNYCGEKSDKRESQGKGEKSLLLHATLLIKVKTQISRTTLCELYARNDRWTFLYRNFIRIG